MAIQRSVRPAASPRPPAPRSSGTDRVLVSAQQDLIGAVRHRLVLHRRGRVYTEREDGFVGELDVPALEAAA